MAGTKTKKTSSEKNAKDSSEDEAPVLVEVYGDGEEVGSKKSEAPADQSEKELEVEESGDEGDVLKKVEEGKKDNEVDESKNDEDELEVKHLKPLNDSVEEIREGLKTEVVGLETEEVSVPTPPGGVDSKDEKFNDDQKDVKIESSEKVPDNNEDDQAFDEEIGKQKRAVRGVFGVGLIVFLVIFGLTGWAFYLKTKWLPSETIGEVVESIPEPTIAPTPMPTPEPLAKEDVVMEILNGSGISGLAGKTATIFEDLDYVVDGVGNGDSVSKTEVYVLQEKEDELWQALNDIKEELSVSSISGYLDGDSDVLIRLVLGE